MTKQPGVIERSVLVRLKRHLKKLAAERDALRDLRHDLESYEESADRGVESLEECIQALSEYV